MVCCVAKRVHGLKIQAVPASAPTAPRLGDCYAPHADGAADAAGPAGQRVDAAGGSSLRPGTLDAGEASAKGKAQFGDVHCKPGDRPAYQHDFVDRQDQEHLVPLESVRTSTRAGSTRRLEAVGAC